MVTGVQTCALPISALVEALRLADHSAANRPRASMRRPGMHCYACRADAVFSCYSISASARSAGECGCCVGAAVGALEPEAGVGSRVDDAVVAGVGRGLTLAALLVARVPHVGDLLVAAPGPGHLPPLGG